VALAWGRLHGDYAELAVNASERTLVFTNSLSPGFGLMWRLFAWAIERGAHWMDLGGLAGTNPAPEDPLRGIVEFKMRFSRDFREVAEEWQLEPHPMLSGAASAARSGRDGKVTTTSCFAGSRERWRTAQNLCSEKVQ
jgi:hypothetical protein